MRRFKPTNIVLDKVHTRHGLTWGAPAMPVVVYFYLAALMTVLVENGASKWLDLVMIMCIWNAFEFLFFGPTSLVLLASVRATERRACGRASIA